MECEEECEEETVLSEKGTSQVWGFSQAMPFTRCLYLEDCDSSFSCLILRILIMSSVTLRKEPWFYHISFIARENQKNEAGFKKMELAELAVSWVVDGLW